MNNIRLILLFAFRVGAWVAGGVTVALGAFPALIAYGCVLMVDDLEAEWRRGRRQNWLWRWARDAKEGK